MAELADAQDSGSCEHLVHAGSSPVVRTRMDPVEPERFDWVFLFLIFIILGIHFKSNGFLFKRKI